MSEQPAIASVVRRLAADWRARAAEWADELDLKGVLTVQEQEIVWLRFFMQLDQREIAAALERRSQQLVSKVLRRALRKAAPAIAKMLPPSARTESLAFRTKRSP